MNNRQAGAYREMVKKEQAASEKWQAEQEEYSRLAEEEMAREREGQQQQHQHYEPEEPQSTRQTSNRPVSRSGRSQSRGGDGGYGRTGGGGDGGFNVTGSGYGEQGSSIYDRALRISSPRMCDDGGDVPQYVQRKVVRQVEVPFTHQVKVPVKTRKVVPTKVKKKIRTTKLCEVPSFKMVDETYTEICERPAVRQKEVWVKKLVPEKYMEKVPVKRTRQVKVPTTVIQEMEDFQIVEVDGSKVLEVDGYRIDEVEDCKVVEVEEYQTYQLEPVATGPAKIDNTRDIGVAENQRHIGRTIGSEVFHVNDPRLNDVNEDNYPDDNRRGTGYQQDNRAKQTRSRSGNRNMSRSQTVPTNATRQQQPKRAPVPLGLKLSESAGKLGVVVKFLSRDSIAGRSGICKGDLITFVNNKPSRNLTEFKKVISNSVGNLAVQVKRTGGVKLTVNIPR